METNEPSAIDRWSDLCDGNYSEYPTTRVNWPVDIHCWHEPKAYIGDDPIMILRLGQVEFRRPASELALWLEAAQETLAMVAGEVEDPS